MEGGFETSILPSGCDWLRSTTMKKLSKRLEISSPGRSNVHSGGDLTLSPVKNEPAVQDLSKSRYSREYSQSCLRRTQSKTQYSARYMTKDTPRQKRLPFVAANWKILKVFPFGTMYPFGTITNLTPTLFFTLLK